MKKCTTPLQRELFDFGLESVSQNTKQFCEQSSVRQSKYCKFSENVNSYSFNVEFVNLNSFPPTFPLHSRQSAKHCSV